MPEALHEVGRETFGREYDLDIFHIVAVADFNMGAMENKGLNVFNDKYVLADEETATDADYAIEAIIAHEYFHNWTGNRITCRDWFQLCLKEGLTVYRDHAFSADSARPRSSALPKSGCSRHASSPRTPARSHIRCVPNPTRKSTISTRRPCMKKARKWCA
jgi:aminopeptidase N